MIPIAILPDAGMFLRPGGFCVLRFWRYFVFSIYFSFGMRYTIRWKLGYQAILAGRTTIYGV